jgi:hypothetical protein
MPPLLDVASLEADAAALTLNRQHTFDGVEIKYHVDPIEQWNTSPVLVKSGRAR